MLVFYFCCVACVSDVLFRIRGRICSKENDGSSEVLYSFHVSSLVVVYVTESRGLFNCGLQVSRLMDLIVHSLYSHKEVFLRELVRFVSFHFSLSSIMAFILCIMSHLLLVAVWPL